MIDSSLNWQAGKILVEGPHSRTAVSLEHIQNHENHTYSNGTSQHFKSPFEFMSPH